MTSTHERPSEFLDSFDPETKTVLRQTERQVGLIANLYVVPATSPGLPGTYLDGHARFRAGSGFSASERDVVFLTISRANRCPYCIAAHSTLADIRSKVPLGFRMQSASAV